MDEARLTKRAIQFLHPEVEIKIFESGKALCAYLKDSDRVKNPFPGVILLDIKMPEMDGFSVLAWIHGKPELADIPVVILSGHSDLEHLKRAYALRARGFLLKPINTESFRNVLSSINISF